MIPGELTSALKAVTSAFTGDGAAAEGFPSSPVRPPKADAPSPAALDGGDESRAAAALAAMPSAAAAALAALAPMAIPAQQEPAHDAEPDVTAQGTDARTTTPGIATPAAATPAATTPAARPPPRRPTAPPRTAPATT